MYIRKLIGCKGIAEKQNTYFHYSLLPSLLISHQRKAISGLVDGRDFHDA